MASTELIRDLMDHFQNSFGRRTNLEEMKETFLQVLGKYTDSQVSEAAWRYLDDETRWPSPGDLTKRIKALTPPPDLMESHEMMTRCTKCGKWRWCRKDGNHPNYECEDCYTGLSATQRRQRYRTLMVKMGWLEEERIAA